MTDAHIVAKKLAEIDAALRDLTQLARPELIETDRRELRFVEHTLQIATSAISSRSAMPSARGSCDAQYA